MSTTYDDTTRTGRGHAPVDGLGRSLGVVAGALADVVDVPIWTLTDEQVQDRLGEALRVRAGVDELVSRLVGSVVERDLATLAGASSARSWLMGTHRMSAGAAARLLDQAKAADTPRTGPTRRAWAAGRLTGEQAVAIGARRGSSAATYRVGAADRRPTAASRG